MDTNATLAEIRQLCASQHQGDGLDEHDTARLVELIEAMDEALTKGMGLPTAWLGPA